MAQDTESVDDLRLPGAAGAVASDELQFQPAGFRRLHTTAEFPGTGREDLERTEPADLSEFTRMHQAGQLAEILNGLVK